MDKQNPDNRSSRKRKDSFQIVGVGASAGGLQAFIQLLEHIPSDIGMAFVLVQHLDPTKKSLLPETLARTTSLPIIEVADSTKVKPNRIYVMPSDSYMTIVDNTLHLTPRQPHSGLQHPIDTFFQSLAKHHGKDAVGIILSGTGSDGTAGFQAIKASGGRTFAQDDSAQFQDMPRSAIGSGSVDFILPPDRIAPALIQISREITSGSIKSKPETGNIGAVLTILKAKAGIDFLQYKQTSVNRRIQRRMFLNHITTVKAYTEFLNNNPTEVEALYKDMLIHVTSFFREPDQYEALKKLVFPALLKNRSSKRPITVWVPGCASGEEAYSIAIALQEFFASEAIRPSIRILGTDIAKSAIEEASAGVYKESLTKHISPKRLRQFFTSDADGYKVKKSIRDMCEFAVADVTQKPPRLGNDLVSCRNTLIYLGDALQQQALFMLTSALKPEGFLLLGKSESLGVSAKFFSPLDVKQKIYSKKALTSATDNLRKAINAQAGKGSPPLDSQPTITTPSDEASQTPRQKKITKLKEAVALTQDYTNEIISELDVVNEKLQSANEELASNSEELQSTNEEMTTLSEELQTRNEDVTVALDYADAIIRTVRGPLLVLNKDLRIISANEAFYNAFKVAAHDTENRLLYDLGNRQWNIPKLKTLLEKILPKSNILTDYEVVHDFKDIGQKTMLLNARTLQQGPDKTSLILLAIEDITENKKAEKALRESGELFRTANETMTTLSEELQARNEEVTIALDYADAIIRTVRGPLLVLSKDLRIISANEAFYNAFKVAPNDTENRLLYDLGNRQWNIPKLKTLLEKILPKNNTLTDYEVVHDFKDIGQKTMLLNARTLQQGPNKTSLILLAIEDITERKQLEQQKDEFISIASHELKTPITSVKAYTQILGQRFRKAEDMKSVELVGKMDSQLDKLTDLIGDLLDITMIEAGRIQFHESHFNFNELVEETIEELQRTTEKHRIVKQLQPSRTVYGDHDRLGQVLTNFMTNAIKYSPHADKIIVKTIVDKDNITLSVQDFGVGLSQEDQAKVFERFYRVGGANQNTYPGLGLGLYIASEIIKRHKGRVWVESEKTKGSTFCFSLPKTKQKK